MPAAIPFIADAIIGAFGGFTAVGAFGAALITAGVTIAVYTGLGLVLSMLANAIAGKKGGPGGGPQSRVVTVKGSIEPRQMIYGEARTGGCIVYYGLGGPNGKFLFYVIALAGHQCDTIEDVWLDARTIKSAEIDPSTGVVASTASGGSFWNGGNPTLWIWKHTGTSAQTVDTQLNTFIPEWDSTHRGAGIAYLVIKMQHNDPAYPNGAPASVFSLVKGRRLYDPRLDTTNGGTGTQRFTDATTWTWSNNWALAIRDYLSGGSIWYDLATPKPLLTINESNARIDDSYVITAANHADEAVTVPISPLTGTLIWTHSSLAVVGTATQFTYQLAAGVKLLGPDGLFYTVNTITDDTHLTLTAVFAGTTTTSGVTTQFNATASTTTTQPRFTCDAQLSCGDTHATNITDMLTGANGHLAYVKGKYRILAGVYDAPTITIGADDIVGTVEVATHPQGQDLYNQVTGTFYDELRGWQAANFPTQQSASYQTTDGGIYVRNVTFPVTRSSFRAQRLANVLLLQSRNKVSVNFDQIGPAAMNIAEWETFQVNIPEYGWAPQILRCVTFKWLSSGYISLSTRVDASASYADLAIGSYQILAGNSYPTIPQMQPDPITGLAIGSVYGGIEFVVTPPTDMPNTSSVLVYEFTSSSPFSSATLVAEFTGTSYVLQKTDGTPRYYWVVVQDSKGNQSTPFPASVGAIAQASMPDFTLVNISNTTVGTNSGLSTGVTSAWNTHKFASTAGYGGSVGSAPGAFVSGQVNAIADMVLGLTANTGGVNTGGVANVVAGWAVRNASTDCAIVHNGALLVTGLPAASVSDVFVTLFDGFWFTWLRNSVVIKQVYAPNLAAALYAYADLFEPNISWNNIAFGPVSAATPNPFIATGNCVTHDSTAAKIAATVDSCVYSIQAYTSCHVQAKSSTSNGRWMVGLAKSPKASSNYANGDYMLYFNGLLPDWEVYELGTLVASGVLGGAVPSITDLPNVTYDGTNVRYWINATLVHTTNAPGLTLHAFLPFLDNGSTVNSLAFGPGTAFDTVPTVSIDPNAASQISSSTSSGTTSFNLKPAAVNSSVLAITLTTTGQPMGIDVACNVGMSLAGGCTFNTGMIAQITRDGTVIGVANFDLFQYITDTPPQGTPVEFWNAQIALIVDDTPSAASHTYALNFTGAQANTGGGGPPNLAAVGFSNIVLKVREYKR